jgi:putative phosphoribosyl transferase
MDQTIYSNRTQAGKVLASKLSQFREQGNLAILGLPRGGIPVAYEVARQFEAPLDVFVVRKLGTPAHEELAMGAIATGGVTVLNDEIIREFGVPGFLVDQEIEREQIELARQEQSYRGGHPPLDVNERTVILVDDGMATGYTMKAAVKGLRERGPRSIVVAVPVAARESCEALRTEADAVVCASTPSPFLAVGEWYEDFAPVTDEQIRVLLAQTISTRP